MQKGVEVARGAALPPLSLEYLGRIEARNLFRLSQVSGKEFTLVLSVEPGRRFVKELLLDALEGMGYNKGGHVSSG